MTDTLLGKVAIGTGSARNIGRAIANELSDRGASVMIHGQGDRAAADAVRGEITDKGAMLSCDWPSSPITLCVRSSLGLYKYV